MNFLVLVLFLKASLVSCIVFSVPHQLATLFKMEEDLVDLLKKSGVIFKSKTLELYFETCQPRFEELPAFTNLEEVWINIIFF